MRWHTRPGRALRAAVVAALAGLCGACTFLQNEFLSLDVAPPTVAAEVDTGGADRP